MFLKSSRYFRLPDVFVTGADGRVRASKEIRRPPKVPGKFLHTLAEGERADQLAFKYYKESRKWWRICDANPEYNSPQSLLGIEAWVTARIPARPVGAASWVELLAWLERQVGVESAKLEPHWLLATEEQLANGQTVAVTTESSAHVVCVRYNRLNLTAGRIAAWIQSAGFAAEEPQVSARLGKGIVIPPDGNGS